MAIEPFPATFERLVEGMGTNEFAGRITPINAAVVGQSGRVYMDDAEAIASHSRKVGGVRGIEVEGLSLNNILEAENIDEVDLLKVDIEGAEYALIEETPLGILRRFKRIGMEYHGNGDTEKLFKKLIDSGFTVGRYPKKAKLGSSNLSASSKKLWSPSSSSPSTKHTILKLVWIQSILRMMWSSWIPSLLMKPLL